MIRKRLVSGPMVIVVLLCAFMLALKSQAIISEPRWGGTLVTTCHDDPTTLNPAISIIESTFWASHNIFSSLVLLDSNFDPQPNLAKSWSISEDALTYTFYLEENVTFHDGTPLTSDDVKFTMEEVIKVHNPWGITVFDCVDHVETPDDHTAAFKLKYAYAPFMLTMGCSHFNVLPKHLYEGTDILNNQYNLAPIGSGPFKFAEWVRGDHITLERYDDYFKQDKPYVDRIVYRIVPDEATIDLMLENGELDYVPVSILPTDVDRLRANPEIVIDDSEFLAQATVLTVVLNCKEGHITADPEVRKAIAYTLNKTLSIELVENGQALVTETAFTPLIDWCYNPNPETKHVTNLTKANEILDAAGYPRGAGGVRFTIKAVGGAWYMKYYKNVELFIPQLSEVGIECDYEKMERSIFNEKVFVDYDYDLTAIMWTVAPDPIIGQERYLTTASILPVPWKNFAHYSNSRVDELFDMAKATADKEERKQCFFEIQDIVNEEVPYLGMYSPLRFSGWASNIGGLPKGPMNSYEPDDAVWFTDQHIFSPRMCAQAIAKAEQNIKNLENRSYDVSLAEAKLEEARTRLLARDYTTAKEYADLAPTFALPPGAEISSPPYDLWTAIIIATSVIVIVLIAVPMLYKRKKSPKE